MIVVLGGQTAALKCRQLEAGWAIEAKRITGVRANHGGLLHVIFSLVECINDIEARLHNTGLTLADAAHEL